VVLASLSLLDASISLVAPPLQICLPGLKLQACRLQ
jgi:hypothetical protein